MANFTCKIDWLSFTFKAPELEPNSIEQYKAFWHQFPELQDLQNCGIEIQNKGERGDRFYNNVICFNDFMRVAYRDCPFANDDGTGRNMGVNVSIPAHGLEFFFDTMKDTLRKEKCGSNDIQKMFALLSRRGCTISRLDVAFDDFDKTYTPADWADFMFSNRIVTNFKSFKYIASGRHENDTFYLGKRSAGKLLRIYDKNGESGGKINAIRYEFEIHGKYCEDYARFIREFGHLPSFSDMFGRFVSKVIVAGSKCENRAMVRIDPDYQAFIDSAKLSFSEQLTYTKFISSEDRLKASVRWIYKSCMPSIRSFIDIFGIDAFVMMYNNSDCHSLDQVFRSNYELHQLEYQEFFMNLI